MTPFSKVLVLAGAAAMVAAPTIASASGAGQALIARGGPADSGELQLQDEDGLSALEIAAIIAALIAAGFLINEISKSN